MIEATIIINDDGNVIIGQPRVDLYPEYYGETTELDNLNNVVAIRDFLNDKGILPIDFTNTSIDHKDLKPGNREDLVNIMRMIYIDALKKDLPVANFNSIDVSSVTDLSNLWECVMDPYAVGRSGRELDKRIQWDVSQWDVSNVTNMRGIFRNSNFNGNISKWNVSKVEDLSCAFSGSNFNNDISNWDVSNVNNMFAIFAYHQGPLTIDLSKWNVSNVRTMDEIFRNTYFAGDISNWNVSNVESIDQAFSCDVVTEERKVENPHPWTTEFVNIPEASRSAFCGKISNWKFKKLESMYDAFRNNNLFNKEDFKKSLSEMNADDIRYSYCLTYKES